MIRPEDMAGFTDPMERIFLDLQNRIMEDVVRRIVKMGEITRTADMQMGTIRKLGGSTSFIRAELKRMAGLTDKELGRLFSDVIKKGYSDNAEIYRRMGRNFIPAAENRILQSWKKALTDQTAGELKNITRSLGMMWEVRGQKRLLPLADVYQQALDDAAMDIVSGGKSYNTVLRRTVSQLTRSGLRTVDYASGTSTRVEVASRRAVMTGVHQLTGQINLEVAKDLNTDYFEVTWHAGARPEHWWGGRVYSRQQLSLVCGYGSVEGLCGANCRHSFYAFIPGVSKRMYSDEQLAEMNAAEQVKKPYADGKSYTTYEATQKQRQMETVMRAQRERIHLLQQGGADDQEILLAKCRYQGEIQEYKRFSKAMGLPPQMERVYIDGLGRKAPTKGELFTYKSSRSRVTKTKTGPSYSQADYDAQRAILKKYGNLSNLMTKGSLEEVQRWSDLTKATGLGEKDIYDILKTDVSGWKDAFEMQGVDLREELSKKTLDVLNDEDMSALRVWSGPTYADMNRYKRYGVRVNDYALENADATERALEKTILDKPLIARRDVSRHSLQYSFDGIEGIDGWENNLSLLEGKQFPDNGFFATTIDKEGGLPDEVTMYVAVPEGTHAAYIEKIAHNDRERELLLQRGYSYNIIKAEYKVKETDQKDRYLNIWLEVAL